MYEWINEWMIGHLCVKFIYNSEDNDLFENKVIDKQLTHAI